MAAKEIQLLKMQIEKLYEKKFDLEAWKSHTVIFFERIFGKESSKIRMIKELKYDYSSWSLRDAAGTGRNSDPVLLKAREILEAAILELEQLGLPKKEEENLQTWSLLEEELTGKQVREIKAILQSDNADKVEKISKVIESLEKEDLVLILTRLLVPSTKTDE